MGCCTLLQSLVVVVVKISKLHLNFKNNRQKATLALLLLRLRWEDPEQEPPRELLVLPVKQQKRRGTGDGAGRRPPQLGRGFQHGAPRTKTKSPLEMDPERHGVFVLKGFVTPVTSGSGTELSQTHGIP